MAENKNSTDNGSGQESFEATKTALIQQKPIHYHILPPSQPHLCDKYGCPREAKYKLGNSYFCDGKVISHFREIAKTCQKEGFELIEDMQQLDI